MTRVIRYKRSPKLDCDQLIVLNSHHQNKTHLLLNDFETLVMEMEELKKEAKNSTTKANLLEDENQRREEDNIALKKLNTAMNEEIRIMKEENRRIEDEKLVEKKLSKGMKVEIDTKKEGTMLTNPERQMKQENRFPWENHRFSEDSRRTGRHTCQRKRI